MVGKAVSSFEMLPAREEHVAPGTRLGQVAQLAPPDKGQSVVVVAPLAHRSADNIKPCNCCRDVIASPHGQERVGL